MSSLNDILTVARSGILSHQERLNVIGHNITNVHTKGYHRQTAALSTNPANLPNISVTIPYAQGTGVRVRDVFREYDMLRERALLEEQSEFSRQEHLAKMLPDLEALLLGHTQEGFNQALNAFWAAWQDVAAYPDNLTMRNVLLERGAQLADQFNRISASLEGYAERIVTGVAPDIGGAVTRDVEEVNRLTEEMQRLNRKISLYEITRVSTADLEDRRDLLARELCKLAEIEVDAAYNVRLDGELLVSADGLTRQTLSVSSSAPLAFEVGGNAVVIERGILGAWGELLAYVDNLGTQLDALAGGMISSINTLHTTGYDLDGNAGLEFFTGATAGDITVNAALYNPANPLLNNPRLVAAAATLHDPGGPNEGPNTGDGAIALAIAGLYLQRQGALGDQTFNDFYTQMNGHLGERVNAAANARANSAMVMRMLENAIQSESGVSLDEELVNMITAQRAYQAAARLAADVNRMFDVIMNM